MKGRFKKYFEFDKFDYENNTRISDLIRIYDIELPGKSISFENAVDIDDQHLLSDDQPKTTTRKQLMYDFECYNIRKFALYRKLILQPTIKNQSDIDRKSEEFMSDINILNKIRWSIIIRCTGIICSFVNKIDGDDIVEQECVHKMHRIADRYDVTLGYSPSTYIINSLYRTISRNSKEEKIRLYNFKHVDDIDSFRLNKEDQIDIANRNDVYNTISTIMNRVCDKRTIQTIQMIFSLDFTYKEIGKELGVTTERARQIVFSGIQLIKSELKSVIKS